MEQDGQRCRFHGGRSPKGIESPNFVHGRRSKYMPDKLATRYEEAVQDPDLLALRGEIALLDARMVELLEHIDTGESGPAWGQLRELHGEMQEALSVGNPQKIDKCLSEMGELIEASVTQKAVWAEVYDVVERIRALKQTEHKRLAAMHQMITVEGAMAMIARIQRVIIDNVGDPDARVAIASELRAMVHRNAG